MSDMDPLAGLAGSLRDLAGIVVDGSESFIGPNIRMGKVTAVGFSSPSIICSVLLASGDTITGVRCLESYYPRVNDPVWMIALPGGRLLAIGTHSTANAPVVYSTAMNGITLGNGTLDQSYQRRGRKVSFKGRLIFGTTTTVSGNIQANLPFPIQFEADIIGSCWGFNPGGANSGRVMGHCYGPTGTTLGFIIRNPTVATYDQVATATTPFTWGANFQLQWTVEYETTNAV